jgi:UDP-N-acetylmuramoyl-tripeptide--D-alanyl-D-alanine ligase
MEPGGLYVALRGDRFDGHAFVAAAMEAGAAAAMVEAGMAPTADGPWLVVRDCRKALVDLARRYRACLQARLLAITGSAGKTTVKELAAAILSRQGATARTHANWNNDIGLPLSLLRAERGDRFGVFELGTNHPGEIATLAEILRPHAAVITTIGPAHLAYFGSEAAIAREKSMVLAALPSDGWAVLPAEDRWFEVMAEAVPGRVITVSRKPRADYVWAPIATGGIELLETRSGERARLPGGPPGDFYRLDAALAVAGARQWGASWADAREVLRHDRRPAMRWELSTLDGVTFVNDGYNANPLSMEAALNAFAELDVTGRRWLVLGAMRELGAAADDYHRALGRRVGAGAWAGLAAYGEWGAVIAEGAREAGMPASRIRGCASPAETVATLRAWVRPDDAVLLKASRSEHLEAVVACWKESPREEPCCRCRSAPPPPS